MNNSNSRVHRKMLARAPGIFLNFQQAQPVSPVAKPGLPGLQPAYNY